MKTMKKKVEGHGTHNSTLSVRVLCVYSGFDFKIYFYFMCVGVLPGKGLCTNHSPGARGGK